MTTASSHHRKCTNSQAITVRIHARITVCNRIPAGIPRRQEFRRREDPSYPDNTRGRSTGANRNRRGHAGNRPWNTPGRRAEASRKSSRKSPASSVGVAEVPRMGDTGTSHVGVVGVASVEHGRRRTFRQCGRSGSRQRGREPRGKTWTSSTGVAEVLAGSPGRRAEASRKSSGKTSRKSPASSVGVVEVPDVGDPRGSPREVASVAVSLAGNHPGRTLGGESSGETWTSRRGIPGIGEDVAEVASVERGRCGSADVGPRGSPREVASVAVSLAGSPGGPGGRPRGRPRGRPGRRAEAAEVRGRRRGRRRGSRQRRAWALWKCGRRTRGSWEVEGGGGMPRRTLGDVASVEPELSPTGSGRRRAEASPMSPASSTGVAGIPPRRTLGELASVAVSLAGNHPRRTLGSPRGRPGRRARAYPESATADPRGRRQRRA